MPKPHLRDRAPGPDFNPPVAQNVERRDPLGDTNWMVVRERQQHDGVTDAYFAGALRDRAVEHLRRGSMREADLEMMLNGPEMGKAHFLGAHHLVHHVVKRLVLALAMLEWAGYLNFVEDSEVHRRFSFADRLLLQSPAWRLLRATQRHLSLSETAVAHRASHGDYRLERCGRPLRPATIARVAATWQTSRPPRH